MPRSPQSGDLVLVTGATGRIGADLCRMLRERGFRIRGVVLPGDSAVAKLAGLDVETAEADLRDEQPSYVPAKASTRFATWPP